MYVPGSNAITDEDRIRSFVDEVGAAELVTVGSDGYPRSTFVPIVWQEDRVVAHFARANDHWGDIADGAPVLLIVRGSHAYVTPTWYAAKREHGRVVPTWNYSAVQMRGTARIFDDAPSLLDVVSLLTEHHESGRSEPWSVADAPNKYIEGMLKAIVGIEIQVEHVDAKAKLSQNRPIADRSGVVEGLRAGANHRGEHAVADQMAADLTAET